MTRIRTSFAQVNRKYITFEFFYHALVLCYDGIDLASYVVGWGLKSQRSSQYILLRISLGRSRGRSRKRNVWSRFRRRAKMCEVLMMRQMKLTIFERPTAYV